MAGEKARPTRQGGSRKASAKTTGRNGSGSTSVTFRFSCPSCGRNALEVTRKPHRDGGGLTTLIKCWNCDARLDDVHEATGISKQNLLGWPPPAELGSPVSRCRSTVSGEPPPLPSLGTVSGWHARLLEARSGEALDYLLGRGISLEVVKRFRIGWDGDRLTFPMRGELLKTRPAVDGAQMKCWPGKDRTWPLYPEVSRDAGWVLVAAGELDALCGISVGLPAVSVTLGAGAWRDDWTEALRGLYVLVCFDNNETALSRQRASELRKAGIRARHLDLHVLGLTAPKGDLSDYLNSGGDPKRIKPPGRRRR